MNESGNNTAIILMHCPDEKGIVASITQWIDTNKGNIIYLDQHVDHEDKVFFMRVEWEMEGFLIPREKVEDYFQTQIAKQHSMKFQLYFLDKIPRMALFVSKLSHCLFDILARVQSGEWRVEVPLIISNHKEIEEVSRGFRIPFLYFPMTKETKAEQEKKEIEMLKKYKVDFIVLARYMQIISPEFISHYPSKIINIHHSFLPAFVGAKPYHAAYKRGVKLIGATSHYVTENLDAGPIIEQDIAYISHKDSVNALVRKGKDLEKIVLSKAVYLHLQRRVLVYNNKTIVFS